MKYVVITYIALGFVLSSVVGIEYFCDGHETFAAYTGSPFVFRQKSPGSSMTHYYSVSGLIVNTIVWTIVLLLIRWSILNFIQRTGNDERFKTVYKGIVVVLIVLTTLNIWIDYIMLGRGFGKGLNYWYFNLDKEAKDGGVDCKGNWGMFLFPT